LPYAFQPIARESWFLWVVLLIIAAVMVWIAVRLEQLRKLGKTGASWIKTLRLFDNLNRCARKLCRALLLNRFLVYNLIQTVLSYSNSPSIVRSC
jgi:putative exporter of polyketide antibiotics